MLEPNCFNGGVNWVRDKTMLSTRCYPRMWLYFLTSFAVCVGIVLLLLIAILACRFQISQEAGVPSRALYEHLAPRESSSSSSDCRSENSNSPCVLEIYKIFSEHYSKITVYHLTPFLPPSPMCSARGTSTEHLLTSPGTS